jgi:hypothetical protein
MLTEKRVDEIFTEMDGLVLELVPDPTSLGPQYFRDHIAVCRNYLNRVGLVLNELNRERLSVSAELRRQEASYAMEFDNLLTNEPSVKNLDSIEDRKAAAGYRLRGQRSTINELKQQAHVLESIYKVVSFRNRELHATMTAVKDQSKMMNAEIRSGSFYGDERTDRSESDRARSGGTIITDDVSAEELAALMADSSTTTPEPAASEPEMALTHEVVEEAPPTVEEVEVQPEAASDEEVMAFLDGGASAVAAPEEDEFAGLLDGL